MHAAATLATAYKVVLDSSTSDDNVRARLFNDLPRVTLKKALDEVNALTRPANDVFYLALEERYRSVRRFLPDLLKHMRFGFSPAGKGVAASLDWLQLNLPRRKPEDDAPQEIVAKAWQRHITREDGSLDIGTYVFCTLDALRRDVFISTSWRYADPRIRLLNGEEWLSARPIICRSFWA